MFIVESVQAYYKKQAVGQKKGWDYSFALLVKNLKTLGGFKGNQSQTLPFTLERSTV